MKFLEEGPTRILLPPPPSSSRGFDLESADVFINHDGSNQGGDDPVDNVRKAILTHEHVFRSQLFDLHRLYWTQKTLMNASPYDGHHQLDDKYNNAAASDWYTADRMPYVPRKEDEMGRPSTSSHTPQNLTPGWNVGSPHPYSLGFLHKSPHQEWVTTSGYQLFHDGHARASLSGCSQQPNRSSWNPVLVKPEPVDLTFTAANDNSNNIHHGTVPWVYFPKSNGRESVPGPREVINLEDSLDLSQQLSRDGSESLRPSASRFIAPVCSSKEARQECRTPKPFDMNALFEDDDDAVDDYGCSQYVNMEPGLDGTKSYKSQKKTILFDLNTALSEDSSLVVLDDENNLPSSSEGSSIIVHGFAAADDRCVNVANGHLGLIRSGECSVKMEVDMLNSDFKNSKGKRTETPMNGSQDSYHDRESGIVQSSQVAGNSSWNCERSHASQVLPHVPNPRGLLLELNSVPDEMCFDGMDERLVPNSNGSSSASQSNLGSSYLRNSTLAHPGSGSIVASSVTDALGSYRQPSLGSTNLPPATVVREIGSVAERVEGGERSEEDTVSSGMQRIHSPFQDGKAISSSLQQKHGIQLDARVSENNPQGGKSSCLFRNDNNNALVSNDCRQQQPQSCVVNNTCSHSVARKPDPILEPVSGVNNLDRNDEIQFKHQDTQEDLMLVSAAETLAQLLESRGACRYSAPARQESEEEMEQDDGPECSYDSYERIVLALPESQEDEWSSPASDNNGKPCGDTATTESSGLRFNTRRGRQLRDFQKDILPGIVSLSRHEICEDMHAFTEIVKFEELKTKGRRSGRVTTRGGSRSVAMKKKRSRSSPYVQRR